MANINNSVRVQLARSHRVPLQIKIKYESKLSISFFSGAGTASRTPISSLGRMHNSRYTIPAAITIISHLYKYGIILLWK